MGAKPEKHMLTEDDTSLLTASDPHGQRLLLIHHTARPTFPTLSPQRCSGTDLAEEPSMPMSPSYASPVDRVGAAGVLSQVTSAFAHTAAT